MIILISKKPGTEQLSQSITQGEIFLFELVCRTCSNPREEQRKGNQGTS